MPRKSLRRYAIEAVGRKVKNLQLKERLRDVMDEEDSTEDRILSVEESKLKRMIGSRYLFRRKRNRKVRKKFDLEDCLSEDSQHFNDEEFLNSFRMTRESFMLFLKEMESKKAFKVSSRKARQRPVAFQLLVFLYRVGNEGPAGGEIRICQFFGIGKGSIKNYERRVVSALHEIIDDVVSWPDANERLEMRGRLEAYGFRHCVGIIDGTLVLLDFRPEKFHECYFSRKSNYALNVMIVCDDNKKITYYTAGWPGSTHDNRVFRNCNLFNNRGEYFSKYEYLLGDSAYSASSIMVQSFKKQSAQAQLQPDKEFFNKCLAQTRISSEHCIGILKARFPCIKRMNIKLRHSKKEVEEIVRLIGACITMHNLLLSYDEDEIPSEWYKNLTDNIDWSMYDEEEERIAEVTEENEDRRQYVFNSLINNFK
jgi:hypothetical protein